MSGPDAARMGATLAAAVAALLPGVCSLASSDGDRPPEDLPVAVTLALDVGAAHWLLSIAAGPALCGALLARMLGRAGSAAEVDEMGAEALAEFCNLLGGRFVSLLGEQGLDAEIGVPRVCAAGSVPAGQCWRHEGQVFMLALRDVSQESDR